MSRRYDKEGSKRRILSVCVKLFIEKGFKKTTNAEWDKLTLTAEEIAVIIAIPEAVLDDANYDIWAAIVLKKTAKID